ncbi:MAG: hypothetical protein AB8G17_20675, partial [Gammaproteobacteria bacterium]
MDDYNDNLGALFDDGVETEERLTAVVAERNRKQSEWDDNAIGLTCHLTGDNFADYERDYCDCGELYGELETLRSERGHLQRILDPIIEAKSAANIHAREALWDTYLDHMP